MRQSCLLVTTRIDPQDKVFSFGHMINPLLPQHVRSRRQLEYWPCSFLLTSTSSRSQKHKIEPGQYSAIFVGQ